MAIAELTAIRGARSGVAADALRVAHDAADLTHFAHAIEYLQRHGGLGRVRVGALSPVAFGAPIGQRCGRGPSRPSRRVPLRQGQLVGCFHREILGLNRA